MSYCFFKVSTDFFSNSSRTATSFFTLASNSSAPLGGVVVKEAMLPLELGCWFHFFNFPIQFGSKFLKQQ